MFGLLEEVIRNQRELLELPTRLEKDKLKEYSQLDRRFYTMMLITNLCS